jgi:hypothetical protein
MVIPTIEIFTLIVQFLVEVPSKITLSPVPGTEPPAQFKAVFQLLSAPPPSQVMVAAETILGRNTNKNRVNWIDFFSDVNNATIQ